MATKEKLCGAGVPGGDRGLKCALPAGHPGPVHQDEHGEVWGDPSLPSPV